jgi:hypothetical protein
MIVMIPGNHPQEGRSDPMSTSPKPSLKREFWRPDERRIWVRKQPQFGWGWAINFAEVVRRLRRRP